MPGQYSANSARSLALALPCAYLSCSYSMDWVFGYSAFVNEIIGSVNVKYISFQFSVI